MIIGSRTNVCKATRPPKDWGKPKFERKKSDTRTIKILHRDWNHHEDKNIQPS